MGGLPEWDGQPPIEELTGQQPAPDHGPGGLAARVLHQMGEADAPPRRRDPAAPDTSQILAELGI